MMFMFPQVYQPPTIFDVSIYASKACGAIHIGNSNMHRNAYALSLSKPLDRKTLQSLSNHTHPCMHTVGSFTPACQLLHYPNACALRCMQDSLLYIYYNYWLLNAPTYCQRKITKSNSCFMIWFAS